MRELLVADQEVGFVVRFQGGIRPVRGAKYEVLGVDKDELGVAGQTGRVEFHHHAPTLQIIRSDEVLFE